MHWRLEIAGVLTAVLNCRIFNDRDPCYRSGETSVGLGHLHFAAGHTGTATTVTTGTISTFSLSIFPGDGSSSTNTITTWEGK